MDGADARAAGFAGQDQRVIGQKGARVTGRRLEDPQPGLRPGTLGQADRLAGEGEPLVVGSGNVYPGRIGVESPGEVPTPLVPLKIAPGPGQDFAPESEQFDLDCAGVGGSGGAVLNHYRQVSLLLGQRRARRQQKPDQAQQDRRRAGAG